MFSTNYLNIFNTYFPLNFFPQTDRQPLLPIEDATKAKKGQLLSFVFLKQAVNSRKKVSGSHELKIIITSREGINMFGAQADCNHVQSL